jgi:LysM repeat protein
MRRRSNQGRSPVTGARRGTLSRGAALAALPALVLAACGGDDDDASGTTTTLPPLGTTTTTAAVVVDPTATTAVDPNATTTTAAATTGAGGTYVVQSGDTLGGIAQRFGVSLADLATANGFDPTDEESMRGLQVGDELVIPGAGTATTVAGATTTTAAATATTAAATTTASSAG